MKSRNGSALAQGHHFRTPTLARTGQAAIKRRAKDVAPHRRGIFDAAMFQYCIFNFHTG